MSEEKKPLFPDEPPQKGHFHTVIALHEEPTRRWEEVSAQVPLLPRGWFELSRLPKHDRIEFTRDFWLSKLLPTLPDETELAEKCADFFDRLEDVGVFLSQESEGSPFEVHMAYTLKEGEGFFHGYPPATKENIAALVRQFGHITFPRDYLAFLEIHDGFSKYVDTGLIRTRDMPRIYQRFLQVIGRNDVVGPQGEVLNPASLVPFYESFGLHCYQCFFADWYSDEEMGNIYFSEGDNAMSNFLDSSHLEDQLAFPTFAAWLMFYLEDAV